MNAQPEHIDFDIAEPMPIGHNNPPGPIDMARESFGVLSRFLADTPVIQTEEDAREAKLFLDRGKASLGDLEAARKAEAEPLHKAWKEALEKYKPATEHLTKLVDEIKARISAFLRAEEERRWAEAEAKRREAEEAIRVAQELVHQEEEAKENASQGEIGIDLSAAIEQTDAAIAEARKIDRQAAVAERDAHVRLGGGFGRVASLRTKETLIVEDAAKALKAIGLTEKIRDAILSSARDYRKLHGELPKGIVAEKERSL